MRRGAHSYRPRARCEQNRPNQVNFTLTETTLCVLVCTTDSAILGQKPQHKHRQIVYCTRVKFPLLIA